MTLQEDKHLKAIEHVVHEYANLASSAKMVFTGKDIAGEVIKPPINIHIWHAFLLDCRKMRDFFATGRRDDVNAKHYVPGFMPPLPKCDRWKDPVDKQLAHITYERVLNPREITGQANQDLYDELVQVWNDFREKLIGTLYESRFDEEIRAKLADPSFAGLPLK